MLSSRGPQPPGHLVPGRTERINNLHYFCFIYYLSLNDVLFWKMTRFSLLHPSMTHSWRRSRGLSRSRDKLPLKAGPWKYCLTLNRSVAQRGLGTTAVEDVSYLTTKLNLDKKARRLYCSIQNGTTQVPLQVCVLCVDSRNPKDETALGPVETVY